MIGMIWRFLGGRRTIRVRGEGKRRGPVDVRVSREAILVAGGTEEQAEDFAFVLAQVHPDRRPMMWEILFLLAITMNRNFSAEIVLDRILGEERWE